MTNKQNIFLEIKEDGKSLVIDGDYVLFVKLVEDLAQRGRRWRQHELESSQPVAGIDEGENT